MSKFNLKKAEERVKFVVAKRALPDIKAQVAFDLDVSGSMRGLFGSGAVQEAVQRVLPVALQFDDNGALDVFTFASGDMIFQPAQVTAANFENYVDREIVRNNNVPKWGGTSYAPILEKNLDALGHRVIERSGGFFGLGATRTPRLAVGKMPSIVYFVTDGESDDRDRTTQLLRACQEAGSRLYVLFLGIGDYHFGYLQQIADEFANTGFLRISDLASFIDSDSLYDQLLPEELCHWLKA